MNVASTLRLQKKNHTIPWRLALAWNVPFSMVDADIGPLTWTENRRSWKHLGHHRHPSISAWNGFLALGRSSNFSSVVHFASISNSGVRTRVSERHLDVLECLRKCALFSHRGQGHEDLLCDRKSPAIKAEDPWTSPCCFRRSPPPVAILAFCGVPKQRAACCIAHLCLGRPVLSTQRKRLALRVHSR